MGFPENWISSLYGDNFIDKIQVSLSTMNILHYRQAFFLIIKTPKTLQRIVHSMQQMMQRTIRSRLCIIRSRWLSIHYITLRQKNQTTKI